MRATRFHWWPIRYDTPGHLSQRAWLWWIWWTNHHTSADVEMCAFCRWSRAERGRSYCSAHWSGDWLRHQR